MNYQTRNLFSIDIDNLTLKESIQVIDEKIINNKKKGHYGFVVTPNVDHVVNVNKSQMFRNIYSSAELTLVDGAPIVFASKLLGKPLKERVSGADITPEIFRLAQEKQYRVFIFGSLEGVPEMAIKVLHEQYYYNFPIDSFSPPFNFEKNEKDVMLSVNIIREFQPDILLVSLGSPKGEKFIYNNLNELQVPMAFQIGASIDFMAGRIKRAPKWMQKFGIEWFYRFIKEPKRMFKRYFINDSYFIILLLRELIKKKVS